MNRRSHQNHVPKIACFNKAKTPLGVDLDALVAAMQKFVDVHFAPVWGTPAKLVKSTGFLKGAWALVFVDTDSDAELEGYHDLTPEGLPMCKVFVRNVLKQKDLVSVTASHEIAEMLVDPDVNLYCAGPKGWLYEYEVADPVEDLHFRVNGIPMTDFVYPTYFEHFHKPGSTRFDEMDQLTRPFQVHKDGYHTYLSGGKEKTIWGSKRKMLKFAQEDRQGHRCSFRRKPVRSRSQAAVNPPAPPKKKALAQSAGS